MACGSAGSVLYADIATLDLSCHILCCICYQVQFRTSVFATWYDKTMMVGLHCGNLRWKVSSTPSRSDDLISTYSIVHHLATSFSSFFLDLVSISRSIPQAYPCHSAWDECGNNSFTMGRLAEFRSIVILIRNCNARLPLSLSEPWNKAWLPAEVYMGHTYHCWQERTLLHWALIDIAGRVVVLRR